MAIFMGKSNFKLSVLKLSETIGGAFIRRVRLLCRIRYMHTLKFLCSGSEHKSEHWVYPLLEHFCVHFRSVH